MNLRRASGPTRRAAQARASPPTVGRSQRPAASTEGAAEPRTRARAPDRATMGMRNVVFMRYLLGEDGMIAPQHRLAQQIFPARLARRVARDGLRREGRSASAIASRR